MHRSMQILDGYLRDTLVFSRLVFGTNVGLLCPGMHAQPVGGSVIPREVMSDQDVCLMWLTRAKDRGMAGQNLLHKCAA